LTRRGSVAVALCCLSFLLLGWSALLVPALSTEIEAVFGQTDAGLGAFYFITAAAYAAGSIVGGVAIERAGRRAVLVIAAALQVVGLVALGGAGTWPVFVLAGVLRSVGGGAIDGGVNGLVVDLFGGSRGRALSFFHIFYALGGVGAPFLLALRGSIGLSWQAAVIATGIATIPLGVLVVLAEIPDGRRARVAGLTAASSRVYTIPLLVLALAIGFYVAGATGVTNWLVRFLQSNWGGRATAELGLFWVGLVAGRIFSGLVAERFDHVKLATTATAATAVGIVAAVIAPSRELSVALFAVVGFTSGPVFPLIMAIGGDRFPDRAAAMSGLLAASGVVGSLAYPPLMGVVSVTAGLSLAMLGTGVCVALAAVALVVVGRLPARDQPSPAGVTPAPSRRR